MLNFRLNNFNSEGREACIHCGHSFACNISQTGSYIYHSDCYYNAVNKEPQASSKSQFCTKAHLMWLGCAVEWLSTASDLEWNCNTMQS